MSTISSLTDDQMVARAEFVSPMSRERMGEIALAYFKYALSKGTAVDIRVWFDISDKEAEEFVRAVRNMDEADTNPHVRP